MCTVLSARQLLNINFSLDSLIESTDDRMYNAANEAELIMLRAGDFEFDTTVQTTNDMAHNIHVCTQHREELGNPIC